MRGERLQTIESLLRGLRGIVDVRLIDPSALYALLQEEARCERLSFLPLRNLGLQEVKERAEVFALLKDGRFRPPPAPTVYLVEEASGREPAQGGMGWLEAGGRLFRILGEEVLESRKPYREKTLFLADSFVLFPERRASPRTPSYFLMPPLGFPELEERQEELGIRRVASISPSALTDVRLREACSFSPEGALATILLGFDWA